MRRLYVIKQRDSGGGVIYLPDGRTVVLGRVTRPSGEVVTCAKCGKAGGTLVRRDDGSYVHANCGLRKTGKVTCPDCGTEWWMEEHGIYCPKCGWGTDI